MENKNGMITVEAVLCLVPFILAILGIISFANIFMVHNKIQHAMYETANELSAYTYFYQALGIRQADGTLHNDIQTETKELTEFLEYLDTARETLEDKNTDSMKEDFTNVAESGKELVSDPRQLLTALVYEGINYGEQALKTWMLEIAAKPLMENYLDTTILPSGGQKADSYLKAYGVKNGMAGLNFANSDLFSDASLKLIDLVVEYDLEIYFFKLFFKDPTIHVVQRAVVPAWLDGDGGSYNGG